MHTEDETLADVFIEPDDLLTILIRYGNKTSVFKIWSHKDKKLSFLFMFLGLYFGAIFQVVCIAAVIFLKDNSKSLNHDSDTESSEISPQVKFYIFFLFDFLQGVETLNFSWRGSYVH